MATPRSRFEQWARTAAAFRGLRMAEFAEAMGMDSADHSRIVNGHRALSMKGAQRFAAWGSFFGNPSAEDLWRWTTEAPLDRLGDGAVSLTVAPQGDGFAWTLHSAGTLAAEGFETTAGEARAAARGARATLPRTR